MNSTQAAATGERADLLESLARQRHFLRYTTRGLTDDQARQRTTASELSLGGLIKHVTAVEGRWARFTSGGAPAMGGGRTSAHPDARAQDFWTREGETRRDLLVA